MVRFHIFDSKKLKIALLKYFKIDIINYEKKI